MTLPPPPSTTGLYVNGGVSVATTACAHNSRMLSELAVMFMKPKLLESHVTVALAPPLLTKATAHDPSSRGRPPTLLHAMPLKGNFRLPPLMRYPGICAGSWSTA